MEVSGDNTDKTQEAQLIRYGHVSRLEEVRIYQSPKRGQPRRSQKDGKTEATQGAYRRRPFGVNVFEIGCGVTTAFVKNPPPEQ